MLDRHSEAIQGLCRIRLLSCAAQLERDQVRTRSDVGHVIKFFSFVETSGHNGQLKGTPANKAANSRSLDKPTSLHTLMSLLT